MSLVTVKMLISHRFCTKTFGPNFSTEYWSSDFSTEKPTVCYLLKLSCHPKYNYTENFNRLARYIIVSVTVPLRLVTVELLYSCKLCWRYSMWSFIHQLSYALRSSVFPHEEAPVCQ